ncbi:MAG TPA: pilus assembly protein TadG-related protein, partial [Caldilineaceae bacterium]|nr:pilus assembly protein TadG-related protein [Caldilineaceae bacterium]
MFPLLYATLQTTRLGRLARQLRREEEGANLVLLSLMLVVLLGFAGLAIDGSNVYFQQQRMQIAADAAALGGARQLALNADHDTVDATIRELAFANYADAVTWTLINNDRGVHVTASRTFEAFFAQLYGYDTFTVSAQAEAQYEPVTGTDNLFPLTLDCDCIDEENPLPVSNEIGDPVYDDLNPDDDDSAESSTPISGTVSFEDTVQSQYEITFLSHVGNTWTYQVRELAGHDLSHWNLGIDTCLSQVVSSDPPGAELGVDGSTGFNGIKWNVNDDFSIGVFSFTLDGDYPAGVVEAQVKAANQAGTVPIRGPICDGTDGGDGGGTPVDGICLPAIDFEVDDAGASLVAGQIVDNEFASWGVHVTTLSPTNHPAMIFDSANPTGNDPDLGSPHQDFGGPGQGVGGGAGAPGRNSAPLGKVLIVAESNNPSNPDDAANGGSVVMTFDFPVRVDEVHILDIDDASAAGTVKAYSDLGGGN